MTTWQFWTLIGVLVLILLAVLSVAASVKALWTKLHELQAMLGRIPRADYQEDLARLQRPLESISGDIARMAQSYPELD